MSNLKFNFYYKSLILFLIILVNGCFYDENVEMDDQGNIKETLNIYSDRHYPIDDTIYATFERLHNVKINLVKGKSEDLLSRLNKEGDATKADLLITADAGRLVQAKKANLLKPFPEFDNLSVVDNHLKDVDLNWIALTKRARIIVFSKERVDQNELSTYEALTDNKWKNRISVRSKENVYNQSLLASLIVNIGSEKAEKWVKGMVENMARPPKGNDRDQVKYIYSGGADIAIVNTYYIGKMLESDDENERKAAESVGVFFPNQDDRGAHINISGVGLVKSSKKDSLASQLINFLLSEEMQKHYAHANYEYPVNKVVKKHPIVSDWGDFVEDDLPLTKVGEYNTEAIKLFDIGGWK